MHRYLHLLAWVVALTLALPAAAAANRAAEFPDPGGEEWADVELTRIAPKLVGANDDFPASVVSHEAVMAKLAKAGLSAVRRTLSWRSVEPWPGASNEAEWGAARSYYDAARAAGMTPVMILGFAPRWAWSGADQLGCPSGNCNRPPAVSQDDAWGRFAREAATRFPEAVFEIWNEPNTVEFWGSAPDPERWAELFRIAHERLAQVQPEIRVIACACAGITNSSIDAGGMPAGEFLRRALAAPASIAGLFDAISLHFFPQGYWPFTPFEFSIGSHLAELLKDVRGALEVEGVAGTPIWFDEVGYWTDDVQAQWYAVGGEEAAQGLARLVRRLITIPDVEAVLVHRAIDTDPGDGTDRNRVRNSTFGLMRRSESLEAKPTFCALAAMSAAWDRSDPACDAFVPEQPPAPEPGTPSDPPPESPDGDADRDARPRVVSLKRIGRRHVRVKARGNQVTGIQLAGERRRNASRWRRWKAPKMKLRVGRAVVRLHVRVRDRAGERSPWVTRTLGRAT